MGELPVSTPPPGRKQRQLRNLLLDRRFQLRYTGYLVGIAVLLSASLGFILWRTSRELIAQSERNVRHGETIVALGDEVVDESRKVSAVVRMNIVKDPVYQGDPDLLDAFNVEAETQDARLAGQKAQLEGQRKRLAREAAQLRGFHTTLLATLFGVLSLLVVAIGAAGIVVTHKIAGPVFKMTRHLRDVRKGQLKVPWGLRKGDELVEFFDEFQRMVLALREQRQQSIERLDAALTELADVPPERLAPLRALKTELSAGLD
jgi:methyl-accepting chemotaxis protein